MGTNEEIIFPNYLAYGMGTYEGLPLIMISMFFLYKLKIYKSIGFGFSGWIPLVFNLYYFRDFVYLIGFYFFIIILIGFFLLNCSLITLKKDIKPMIIFEKNEVRDYIIKLSSIYSEIAMRQILKNLHLKRRYLNDLKNLIEEMIYNKEIEGELNRDILVLKKATEKEIITERSEINNVNKKKLFGMIRLRKEINLDEAAEFLNLKPKEIESLLYELAGENTIQGIFQGSKFIIESDIDQFIDVLDRSFIQWEGAQNRYKIE
ncbi:MAG: hypothetical protein ACFFDH_11740 [Promethearchaeota archaeon]